MYGRCCGGEMDYWGCGGFVGGKTALSQYDDGDFSPFATYVKAGTNLGTVTFKLEWEVALDSK